jgi:LPPG:FO 2-phospho-L-lactate transferase
MSELGYEVSASAVAAYYGDILTGFVYDERDKDFESHGLNNISLNTMMITDEDKSRLAREILHWIETGETA